MLLATLFDNAVGVQFYTVTAGDVIAQTLTLPRPVPVPGAALILKDDLPAPAVTITGNQTINGTLAAPLTPGTKFTVVHNKKLYDGLKELQEAAGEIDMETYTPDAGSAAFMVKLHAWLEAMLGPTLDETERRLEALETQLGYVKSAFNGHTHGYIAEEGAQATTAGPSSSVT